MYLVTSILINIYYEKKQKKDNLNKKKWGKESRRNFYDSRVL